MSFSDGSEDMALPTRAALKSALGGISESDLDQAFTDLERTGGISREGGCLLLHSIPPDGATGPTKLTGIPGWSVPAEGYASRPVFPREGHEEYGPVTAAVSTGKHYLYVVEHREFEAVKVGISAEHAWLGKHGRLAAHEKYGWVRRNELLLPTIEVRTAERTILRRLWQEGHRPALTPAQMPQGGATETFNSADVPAARLWHVIGEVCGFIGEGVA